MNLFFQGFLFEEFQYLPTLDLGAFLNPFDKRGENLWVWSRSLYTII